MGNASTKATKLKLNELMSKLEAAPRLQKSSTSSFFIFDYAPGDELLVREHIDQLVLQSKPQWNIANIDLFKMSIDMLRNRKLLESAIKMQNEKGDKYLLRALAAPLDASRMAEFFLNEVEKTKPDLIFVTGVGSAYPLVRSHLLLNNLSPRLKEIPLVLFYPGNYDEKYLTLFNLVKSKDFYQAFRLN